MTVGTVLLEAPTDISEARRRGAMLAEALHFDDVTAGRVAIVITEAATNVIRHGGGGEVFVGTAGTAGSRGIQVIAMDRGPGIPDLSECLRDGFSTVGTAGNGLGAIHRVASTFDIHSAPGRGTVLSATILPVKDEASFGGICTPVAGETRCGDAWAAWCAGELTSLFVVDGLGHGAGAAEAAQQAIRAFEEHAERSTTEVLASVHAAMRSTRGGAVAIAELDRRRSTLKYSGLGNIGARIIAAKGTVHHLVSLPGIAGHAFRRMQEFSHPWEAGSVLVMHTDGVGTNWMLPPSILDRRADVIAGTVYRDARRGRDDATVVAIRNEGAL